MPRDGLRNCLRSQLVLSRTLAMTSLFSSLPSVRGLYRRKSSGPIPRLETQDTDPFDVQAYINNASEDELRQVLLALSSEHDAVRKALEQRSKDSPRPAIRQTASYKKRRAEEDLVREEPEVTELGRKKEKQPDSKDILTDAVPAKALEVVETDPAADTRQTPAIEPGAVPLPDSQEDEKAL